MGTRRKLTAEEQNVVETVSGNVRRLMQAMEWSEHDLARASGVSQKAINNLLNRVTGCNVGTAHKLAKPFGLTGWQLMLEDIPADQAFASTLTRVVQKLISTDKAGRDFILSAIDRA